MPDLPRFAGVIACSKAKDPRAEPVIARERYRGRAFRLALAAVDNFRDERHRADLFIVSARFGVVGEWDAIPYYDASIPTGKGISVWRESTRMPEALLDRLATYDAAVVALPRAYLDALGVTAWRPASGFLVSSGTQDLGDGWEFVPAGKAEAHARSVAPREVGVHVFAEVLARLKRGWTA